MPLAGRVRRSVAAPDDGARAVVGASAAVHQPGARRRLAAVRGRRLGCFSDAAALLPAAIAIAARGTDSVRFGQPVPTLRLATPLPNPTEDAYNHCVAVLRLQAGGNHQTLRVLGNTAALSSSLRSSSPPTRRTCSCTPTTPSWRARSRATSATHTALPRANPRLASRSTAIRTRGDLGLRCGAVSVVGGVFLTDFTDPNVTTSLQAFGATHLQWDALLDGEFARSSLDHPPPADVGSAIALRRFWLPIRF